MLCQALFLASFLYLVSQAFAAQAVLTWQHTPTVDAPTVATGFQILHCQGQGCTPIDLPGATTGAGILTYTHLDIDASKYHCYQVAALATGLRSAPSTIECGPKIPTAPTELTINFTGIVTLTVKP